MTAFDQIRNLLRPFIPRRLRPWQLAVNDLSTNLNQSVDIEKQPIILGGPFERMVYVNKSVGSVWEPKILGTYECELHHIIEELSNERFDVALNIGAAEGYYAVGFAFRGCATKIIAYESDSVGRKLLKELAELNNVSNRIEIRETCTSEQLFDDLKSAAHPLMIMDVEGAESQLFGNIDANALKNTTALIELHEVSKPGVTSTLMALFQDFHSVELTESRPRSIGDIRVRSKLLARLILPWTDELRTDGKVWLYARPKV